LGRSERIPGALDDLPSALRNSDHQEVLEVLLRQGRSGAAVERAVRRLGRRVLAYADRSDAWGEMSSGVLRLELLNALDVEHAETFEDVVRRRLDLEFTPSHGVECVSEVMALLEGVRDSAALSNELNAWCDRLNHLHALLGIGDFQPTQSQKKVWLPQSGDPASFL